MGDLAWLDPLRSSNAAIFLKDANDIVLWVNDTTATATGMSSAEIVGKTPSQIVGAHNRSESVSLEIARRVIKQRRVWTEVNSLSLQGVERWYDVRHTPVPPDRTDGHGWCVLVHAIDVTAQVQLAAMNAMLGLRKRGCRPIEGDEAFVRLLLSGSTVRDLCTALNMSVDEVSSRLIALAGTPV